MSSPGASAKPMPGGVDTSPLAGKVPRCLEPKTGSASKVLWLLLSFCSPHSHLHRLSWRDPGTKMGLPSASAKPSQAGRTPLLWQGRCPDIWSLKQGLPQKLCYFFLSQNLCSFYSLHTHLCRLVSLESGNPERRNLKGASS